ncbi:MAG: DUF5602 domain-containing protein [Ferruginibacter sp.]
MKKVFSIFFNFKQISYMLVLFSIFCVLALSSCKKDHNEPDQNFKGAEVTMGAGKANTFFKMSASGIPLEIGYEMTMSALTGLPQNPLDFANSTFVLPLDPKALELTPFDHLVINWNVQGHPPVNIFTVPHFDFHFYTITLAEQMAIVPYSPATAAKFDLLPPAGYMPASYVADQGGIPGMGKHWEDPTLHTPFDHVMIYGSYNGVVNFVEPMITLATLQAGTTIQTSYAQPQNFAKAGKWYPTKYNIYQDQQSSKHFVSLSEFVKR